MMRGATIDEQGDADATCRRQGDGDRGLRGPRRPGPRDRPHRLAASRSPGGPGPSSCSSSSVRCWPSSASPSSASPWWPGVVLAITFFGLVIIAAVAPGRRGIGGLHAAGPRAPRRADRGPRAVRRPPGLLRLAAVGAAGPHRLAVDGLRRASRSPWRSSASSLAFSVWFDAFSCLTYPLWGRGETARRVFGLVRNLFRPGYLSVGTSGSSTGSPSSSPA